MVSAGEELCESESDLGSRGVGPGREALAQFCRGPLKTVSPEEVRELEYLYLYSSVTGYEAPWIGGWEDL